VVSRDTVRDAVRTRDHVRFLNAADFNVFTGPGSALQPAAVAGLGEPRSQRIVSSNMQLPRVIRVDCCQLGQRSGQGQALRCLGADIRHGHAPSGRAGSCVILCVTTNARAAKL
jgi:hypothetical protein